jgi:protein crumbs
LLPCQHNSTCNNLVNDYSCECWPGFQGKDCQEDVLECAESPCQNNATCYEHSNMTLHSPAVLQSLPMDVRDEFSQEFSYAQAAGYLCHCLAGFEGADCEVNIDECASRPCQNGAACHDGIAEFSCECLAGFEGLRCETNIDECVVYQPCQNGAHCMDLVDDYVCSCEPGFGGKNCSVPLTGCTDQTCFNGGTCTPYLVGETDHRFNCSCVNGFDGRRCQLTTTMSFKGDSFVSVNSTRAEGFEMEFRFRTTLLNGLLAIGSGESFFTLQLKEGSLNLHSSMLNVFEGISIGEELSNGVDWQKVYISVNFTHLTIGLNVLQRTDQINPDNSNQTAFQTTYLGGADATTRLLAKDNKEQFVGCIQDISVNGQKVTEDAFLSTASAADGMAQQNTEKGCARKDQCAPNPCMNHGVCTDLWRRFSCECERPFLGSSCQYAYTGATFGYENTTDSQVVVDIENPNAFNEEIELTMFIRSRQSSGLIFYLGKSDYRSPTKNHIRGSLANGTLQVEAAFGPGKPEMFKLYSVQLDDGNRHFLRVIRMKNKMIVSINSTNGFDGIAINQEVSSIMPIQAEKLYLGNLLSLEPVVTVSPTTTTVSTTTTTTIPTTTSALPLVPSPSPPTPLAAGVPPTPSPGITAPPVLEVLDTTVEAMEAVTQPPEDLATASTAPIVSRQRRQEPSEAVTTFFKGVIKDIRLSNRKGEERIVELYELQFGEGEVVPVEPSLGPVTAHGIQEGVVSDDTCLVQPCQNSGECKVGPIFLSS